MATKRAAHSIAVNFRIDPETVRQLDELCKIGNVKRGTFIAGCIHSEYDKMQQNPQMKIIMDKFNDLSKEMEKLGLSAR